MEADIRIKIWNDNKKEYEKPSKYNTYFDNGFLHGVQDWLIVEYEISIKDSECDTDKEKG